MAREHVAIVLLILAAFMGTVSLVLGVDKTTDYYEDGCMIRVHEDRRVTEADVVEIAKFCKADD